MRKGTQRIPNTITELTQRDVPIHIHIHAIFPSIFFWLALSGLQGGLKPLPAIQDGNLEQG